MIAEFDLMHVVMHRSRVPSHFKPLGKALIEAYIDRSGVASGFGVAGSLVGVLFRVYFSAHILLVDAEFTCVYARTLGSQKPAAADS